jgi:drug/metabolite transporter (DMT)-like permease
MAADRERVASAAFLTGSLLAGGNAVGVRFSNRELAPLWGAGLRFLVAAALLVAAMVVLRQPLPHGRALTGALIYGLFNFGGAFALAYYGFVQVHPAALPLDPQCQRAAPGYREGRPLVERERRAWRAR